MKSKLSICFEPTEKCTNRPIKSHSIQNRKIIDYISKDDHVIMFGLESKTFDEPFQVSLTRVGRNNATIFYGLCARHDNQIFDSIDNIHLDLKNQEQLFLLVYRAVLKELYSVSLSAYRFETMFNKMTGEALSFKNKSENLARIVRGHIVNSNQMYLYKKEFDNLYLSHKFNTLVHHNLKFKHQYPTIAASSVFSLDEIKTPHYVARIILNIFPDDDHTNVVFSSLPMDTPYANQYLEKVFSSSDKKQKNLISKIVLETCENFILSPSFFESLPANRKSAILSYFQDTLFQSKSPDELEPLCLFE